VRAWYAQRALACLLAAWPVACQRGPAISFLVKVSAEHPDSVQVELEASGVPGSSLTLRAFAPEPTLRLSGLEAVGPDGSSLRIDSIEPGDTSGGHLLQAPRYTIRGPLPETFRVRYSVRPGSREGDTHFGFTGRSHGYSGPEFSFFTGRNLFLLPDPPESLRSVSVRFALPDGWQAVAPWRRDGDRFVAGVDGRLAAESLVKAFVGLGRFHERAVEVGGTHFRIAFESNVPPEAEERASTGLEAAIRYVHGLFGRRLGPEYLIVVAPRSPTGDELEGEAWSTGQGGTLAPLTAGRLRTFAANLIDAYLRLAPYRSEIRDPKQYWVIDAVRSLYSQRAVASAGLIGKEEIARELAVSYLKNIHVQGVEHDLEKLYDGQGAPWISRETFAPFTLLMLEHELASVTNGSARLDDLIGRMFSGRRAASLWSMLPAVRPGFWEQFQASYVRGAKHIPADLFYTVTPAGEAPNPPAGKVARRLTLAYTGETKGYLENCGCKVNQSGGVARRATFLERVRRKDPAALVLDAGDSFIRPETQTGLDFLSRQEQTMYLRTLDMMRYDAVALGANELAHGLDFFREVTRHLTTPYLTANVRLAGRPIASPSVRRTANGLRVAVIGVFEPPRGSDLPAGFEDNVLQLTVDDPVETVQREARALGGQADVVIALGRLTPLTIRRLADACPELDVIVSSEYEAPVPAKNEGHSHLHGEDVEGFVGRTLVLYTHLTSYGVSTARLGVDADGRIAEAALDDVWLNEKVPDQPRVREVLNAFYDRVGKQAAAQESVRPLFADDPARMSGRYVGARQCGSCHDREYAQWFTTGHATAFKTLLDRHRNFQPKCVSCHVVGYGTDHGYRLGAPEQALANVQCEVCHGPGGEHVLAPASSNIRRQVPERVCLECHNPDHSDHFVYAERLPRVRHDSAPGVPSPAAGEGEPGSSQAAGGGK